MLEVVVVQALPQSCLPQVKVQLMGLIWLPEWHCKLSSGSIVQRHQMIQSFTADLLGFAAKICQFW